MVIQLFPGFPGFDPLHQFIDVRCRGGKCSIWEGGTRGTALIYAPSFLPAGGDPGNQVRWAWWVWWVLNPCLVNLSQSFDVT